MYFKLLVPALCLVTGCTQASATLDSSNDIHCAAVMHTIELNMPSDAPRDAQRGIYAVRSWYYRNISREDLKEIPAVVEILKKRPQEIASGGEKCVTRAFQAREFSTWSSVVLQGFKPKS